MPSKLIPFSINDKDIKHMIVEINPSNKKWLILWLSFLGCCLFTPFEASMVKLQIITITMLKLQIIWRTTCNKILVAKINKLLVFDYLIFLNLLLQFWKCSLRSTIVKLSHILVLRNYPTWATKMIISMSHLTITWWKGKFSIILECFW